MIHYSFQEIDTLAKILAEKIEAKHPQRHILTFTRGGVWASAFVVNHLSWKPMVLAIDPTSVIDSQLESIAEHHVVFLDDILDTGNTLNTFEQGYNCEFSSYFLIDKQTQHRIYTPTDCSAAQVLTTEDWLVFPWEELSTI